MDLQAWMEQALDNLRRADDEALRSQAAFASGRFESYWQERGAEAQARLDAIYGTAIGSPAAGGDSQPDSDGGSGTGGGG